MDLRKCNYCNVHVTRNLVDVEQRKKCVFAVLFCIYASQIFDQSEMILAYPGNEARLVAWIAMMASMAIGHVNIKEFKFSFLIKIS